MAFSPASTKASSNAKLAFSSAVHPKTLPPSTSGAISIPVPPSGRISMPVSPFAASARHLARRPAMATQERHKAAAAHTTRAGSGCPAKKAARLSTASMPIAVRVSIVALPMWGRSVTFGSASSPSGTFGSSA